MTHSGLAARKDDAVQQGWGPGAAQVQPDIHDRKDTTRGGYRKIAVQYVFMAEDVLRPERRRGDGLGRDWTNSGLRDWLSLAKNETYDYEDTCALRNVPRSGRLSRPRRVIAILRPPATTVSPAASQCQDPTAWRVSV
jgi:hypothetical protein